MWPWRCSVCTMRTVDVEVRHYAGESAARLVRRLRCRAESIGQAQGVLAGVRSFWRPESPVSVSVRHLELVMLRVWLIPIPE